MTQVTQAGQSGGNAVAEKRVDFTYDAEDKYQFTSITRYADLAGTETVATSTYGYDYADQLTSITHVDSGSSTLAGYAYSYDAANRLTAFTVYGYSAEDATYSYDDTDQLTGADRSGTTSDESYTYDENGNRTGSGYTTGDNNQTTSDGTYDYTYDDEGNRLTKTNISTGEVIEYGWDYRDRLTSITTKDSLSVVTHSVEYTYDAFNRRIVKSIDVDGAGAGIAAGEIYIYDGLREERGDAGDHILLAFNESGDLTDRFMYGPNVDQVLASEEVASTSSAGDVLWALTDNLGTVRDVAEYDSGTDTTTIVNHLAYDSFGEVTSETNSAVDFLFGFTGRERDDESSAQYYRGRYLESGRWISEDPLGFDAMDANLYRYVGNHPAYATDPSGMQENSAFVDVKGNEYGDWKIKQEQKVDGATIEDLVITPASIRTVIKFVPSNKCKSTLIAFVQIATITGTNNTRYNEGREYIVDRTGKSGWYIDRTEKSKYGWFGQKNDGEFAESVRTGVSSETKTQEAIFVDRPSTHIFNLRLEFQAVAIAKEGADAGKVYGYLTWGMEVDDKGKLTALTPTAHDGVPPNFQDAVDAWNDNAKQNPDGGKVPLGPFIK